MSTRDSIREIAQRPNFHTLTLQEIGDEVGVTRERARQVLKGLGIKRRRVLGHKNSRWLATLPDTPLINSLKSWGSIVPLAQAWGVKAESLRGEFRRRGLSVRRKAHMTKDELRAENTARCLQWRAKNPTWVRDYLRQRRVEEPGFREREKAYHIAWERRHPGRTAQARKHWYWQIKGTDDCPVCGGAHECDLVRYERLKTYWRNRYHRSKPARSPPSGGGSGS